jgi:hypothetical protein
MSALANLPAGDSYVTFELLLMRTARLARRQWRPPSRVMHILIA